MFFFQSFTCRSSVPVTNNLLYTSVWVVCSCAVKYLLSLTFLISRYICKVHCLSVIIYQSTAQLNTIWRHRFMSILKTGMKISEPHRGFPPTTLVSRALHLTAMHGTHWY